MLITLRTVLAAEPEKRPNARRVGKGFEEAIQGIPSGKGERMELSLHCILPGEKKGEKRAVG